MNLLANGTYLYWRDGIAQPIREPWTLSVDGGDWLLSGQRVIEEVPRLGIDARYRDHAWQDCALDWLSPQDPWPQTHFYFMREGALRWRAPNDIDDHALTLPSRCLLFPLLRAAAGPLLWALTRTPRWVVVPELKQTVDTRRFLSPSLSERRACVGASPQGEQTHYRYFGGEYGENGADYWIDHQGLLRRYTWQAPDGLWECRLIALETAPPFRGFPDPATAT